MCVDRRESYCLIGDMFMVEYYTQGSVKMYLNVAFVINFVLHSKFNSG